jgi:SAM-dependent methyltransferase
MDEECGREADVLARFGGCLRASIEDGSFVRLVLSPAKSSENRPDRLAGRLVEVGGKLCLSLTFRYPTRDEVQNIPAAESFDWVLPRLGRDFANALLCTTRNDWQLTLAGRRPQLIRHKPSVTCAPARAHDAQRHVALDEQASDWLTGLGVFDSSGKVRAHMSDKFTQINRYLEIFSHLANDAGWIGSSARADANAEPWTVLDMGSGKGYLTFGLWHLLVRKLRLPVQVIGVESREALVAATNGLAQRIVARGLQFIRGNIADAALPNARALIALHACDTATDDAILRGIAMGSELIVLAPCCHKEIRPQLGCPEPLAPVLRHGLMAGRMADWLTDGLRALFLEWAGYRTKIFEFVDAEHTAKNLMISAVRDRPPFSDPRSKAEIVRLKDFFGLAHHALDPLLVQAQPMNRA